MQQPPAPAGPGGTHGAVLQPLLEAVLARCWLCNVPAALRQDPPHQDLLQLGVVLPVDLLLHLPAEAIRWSPVCHADGGGVCKIGPPSAAPVAPGHPARDRHGPVPRHGGAPREQRVTAGTVAAPQQRGRAPSCPARLPGRPARRLITRARRCPGSALPAALGTAPGLGRLRDAVPTAGTALVLQGWHGQLSPGTRLPLYSAPQQALSPGTLLPSRTSPLTGLGAIFIARETEARRV